MKRSLFLFLLCGIAVAAPAKQTEPEAYTRTETDLKIQLQQQEIDALRKELESTEISVKESLDRQEQYVKDIQTSSSNYISTINTFMTIIAVVIAALGFVGFWKLREYKQRAKKEIDEIKKIKCDVEKAKEEGHEHLVGIIADHDESAKLVEEISKMAADKKLTPQREKDLDETVKKINETKPEARLTAKDWFLKGYEAQAKNELKNACYFYSMSVQKEETPSAYNNWGNALLDLAKMKGDESLCRESLEKYAKAAELDPTDSAVYFNWGSALSDLAKMKGDESLYRESLEKYAKAAELDPKDFSVYNNWGSALSILAKMKGDESLYRESLEKYTKAAELDSSRFSVYNNWGSALSNLAEMKRDAGLYEGSIEKYRKSIELDPDNFIAYSNWICAVGGLVKLGKPVDACKGEIESMLQSISEQGKDELALNTACLYSLLGEAAKSLEWLERYLKTTKDKKPLEEIASDTDFDNIRDTGGFKTLIEKYTPKK